jgi:hypothetical protein
LVRDCSSEACGLHPYRTGKIKPGADRRLLKIIRKFCLSCVGSSDEVKKCSGKMLDGTVCNLHQYRMGKRPKKHEQEASFASNFNELVEA